MSIKDRQNRVINTADHRAVFLEGVRVGFPIGLGYFAVAFSLGIAARGYGITPFQGFLASLITYASAGQYMGFSLYAASAGLLELVLLTIIINLRYILMGFALNQRMPAGTSVGRRVLVGSCITDEIFGATIARPGAPTPYYTFGALLTAAPMWALGTAIGIGMGNILPSRAVSALSVALFGMFLATIIPASKRDRGIMMAVIASFACSYAAAHLPLLADLSQGTRTIILTISISAIFALLLPHEADDVAPDRAAGAEDVQEVSHED